jgi:hypothetical protein
MGTAVLEQREDGGDPRGSASGSTPQSRLVMRLLAEHVPLTLLADLVDPWGPSSSMVFESELHQRTASRVWETVRVPFVVPEGAGTAACTGRHPACGTDLPCPMNCWASPLVELPPLAL